MKTFFIIILIVTCITANSQDYRLFVPDKTYLYMPQAAYKPDCYQCKTGKYLRGVEITKPDTIQQNLVYTFHQEFDGSDLPGSCISSGASWVGEKLVVTDSASLIIINNDTILFVNAANMGDKWVLKKNANETQLVASVIGKEFIKIDGIEDSVKKISISKENKEGTQIPSVFDGTELKLSKEHGLITLIPFKDLDLYLQDSIPHLHELFYLENCLDNNPLLTLEDVYNYEIGDLFHIIINSTENYIDEQKYLSKRVILKEEFEDSVRYRFEVDEWKRIFKYEPEPHYETIFRKYELNEHYAHLDSTLVGCGNNLPMEILYKEEPFNDDQDSLAFSYGLFIDSSKYNSRFVLEYPLFAFMKFYNETCYSDHTSTHGINFTRTTYIEGCGKHISTRMNFEGRESSRNEDLVYFKKGSEEWGNPNLLPNNVNKYQKYNFKIYPNPATNILTISNENIGINSEYKIQIYHIDGRLLFNQNFDFTRKIEIDISFLKEGIYILKFSNETQYIYKIVKK